MGWIGFRRSFSARLFRAVYRYRRGSAYRPLAPVPRSCLGYRLGNQKMSIDLLSVANHVRKSYNSVLCYTTMPLNYALAIACRKARHNLALSGGRSPSLAPIAQITTIDQIRMTPRCTAACNYRARIRAPLHHTQLYTTRTQVLGAHAGSSRYSRTGSSTQRDPHKKQSLQQRRVAPATSRVAPATPHPPMRNYTRSQAGV